MKTLATTLAAVAVLALGAGPAAAAVELQKLGWQMTLAQGAGAGAAVKTAKPIEALAVDPAARKLSGRLMGAARLLNRGAAVEGLLLRYSVTAKIEPVDGSEAAVWTVPFMLETRRVPKVDANKIFDVPLDATIWTELFLKKLQRGRRGFWLCRALMTCTKMSCRTCEPV